MLKGKIIRMAYACSRCDRIATVEYICWPGGKQLFDSTTSEKLDDYFLDDGTPVPSDWSLSFNGELVCDSCSCQ